MVVRELVALLGVKTDQQSVKKAEGGMSKLATAAKAAAAAFAAFKLGQWAKKAVQEIANLGDTFDKMSKRSGVATQTLQGLEHAAGLSGASLTDVETSLKMLQKTQIEAGDGLETYTREFARLGLETKKEDGTLKDTTELFFEMGDAMKALPTDAERTAVSMKLLGRSGTRLIPLMNTGSDAMREMAAEVSELGAMMDKDMVKASADLIDNQRRLNLVFRSVKISIAKGLMPWMNRALESTVAWWKANQEWIREDIGGALKRIGRVFFNIGKMIGDAASAAIDFWKGLTKSEKGIMGIIGAVGLLGIALSTGPIGKFLALLVLIGLVIDDFQTWKKGGRSVIGAIIEKMDELLGMDVVKTVSDWKDGFVRAFSGIVETLAATSVAVARWMSGDKDAWKKYNTEMGLIWESWGTEFERVVGKTIDFYKQEWQRVMDWYKDNIIDPIEDFIVGGGILGTINRALGASATDEYREKMDKGSLASMLRRGGAQTTGKGRRGGGGGINQNMNMQTTINAAAGMSEAQIAEAVASLVKKALDKQNRDALKAFVPAAEPSVFGF